MSKVVDLQRKNVLGDPLEICGCEPMTGYFRDGFCRTDETDQGLHVVCAEVTETFLKYSRERGNDLMTPQPAFGFEGLKPGDHWCLCASRWLQAHEAGFAPLVNLEATDQSALDVVSLEILKRRAAPRRIGTKH